MSPTLQDAERWMRHIANGDGQSDTEQCHRLIVAELDRRAEKLGAIAAMLPRLRAVLPDDLAAELGAHVYVLPPRPLTPVDVARGQEIAAELAASSPETGDVA